MRGGCLEGALGEGWVANSLSPCVSTVQSAMVPKTSSQFQFKLFPPQWVNCDLRFLDMSVLGKFAVVMADPPWDIHMELPYGTMSDEEMRSFNIPVLQDEGYIFIWVTGRAMELARECLTLWGYERVDELGECEGRGRGGGGEGR